MCILEFHPYTKISRTLEKLGKCSSPKMLFFMSITSLFLPCFYMIKYLKPIYIYINLLLFISCPLINHLMELSQTHWTILSTLKLCKIGCPLFNHHQLTGQVLVQIFHLNLTDLKVTPTFILKL